MLKVAMNYLVAQLGARRHYAIPRMLHEAGMLAHFYTDICATKGWPRLLRAVPEAARPTGLKRLLGRVPHGVSVRMITTFNGFGLEYHHRRTLASNLTERLQVSSWSGHQFCRMVLEHGLGDADGVYTFNGAGLELLVEARRQGLRAVMEQTIAPFEVEEALLRKEHKCFPNWETELSRDDEARATFITRQRAEWDAADTILCGSEYVREGIAACGGPNEKCHVVPYGVDMRFSLSQKIPHSGKLRVLTVGAIGLRKGSPYVLEAAHRLRGQVHFRMVGGVNVLEGARRELAEAVELTGPVPRASILEHFAWADVFLLPSICEGSATVVYEALAAGLPVVCTPNTGSVVRDGIEGFIVPIRDVDGIENALSRFIRQPELLREMGENARQRVGDFTLERYRERLIQALGMKSSV